MFEALSRLQNASNAAPDELVVVDEDDRDHGDADDTPLRDIRNDGRVRDRMACELCPRHPARTGATNDAGVRALEVAAACRGL